MNFRAEAVSDTSIQLSWDPPRQENIIKFDLHYREGEHGKEVKDKEPRYHCTESIFIVIYMYCIGFSFNITTILFKPLDFKPQYFNNKTVLTAE